MKTVALTKDKYKDWDKFCLESDDAWFVHTSKWLEMNYQYSKERYCSKSLSFFVEDDSGVLAVVPLFLEKRSELGDENHYEFSYGGRRYGITPALRNDLSEQRREKVIKYIFEHLDGLALENNVTRSCFRITMLAPKKPKFNWMMKYGYFDAPVNTQLIDLTLPLDQLWSALRKGHKYDVNRGKKFYQIHVFSKENPDKEAFEQYRLLHHKASGRVTRGRETFDLMYDWLVSGEGVLFGVSKDDKFVGFSYVNVYKETAYYSSASDDPEFVTKIPISHVIQWEIIAWLKQNGYKTYEIGLQQFGPQFFDVPSPKHLQISLFKRGFGGRTAPIFHGIKYYNEEYMKKELEHNLQQIIKEHSRGLD